MKGRLLPFGHGAIIKAAKELGYKAVNETGVCFGIGHMGAQAMLCGNKGVRQFDQRCYVINETPSLVKKIKSLQAFLSYFLQPSLTARKKALLLSVPAFIEGVLLHQNLPSYLVAEKDGVRPHSQQAIFSFPLTSPVELSSIIKMDDFVGIYKLKTLEAHFSQLRFLVERHRGIDKLPLILSANNHLITIAFSPQKKCWMLIDANQLPTQLIYSDQALAFRVRDAFGSTAVIVMRTAIYTTPERKDQVGRLLDTLRKTNTWKMLHEPNAVMLARYANKDKNKWLARAVDSGSLSQVNALMSAWHYSIPAIQDALIEAIVFNHVDILMRLMEERHLDVHRIPQSKKFSPLMHAISYNNFHVVQFFLEKQHGDLNTLQEKITYLRQAIHVQNAKMVQLLIDHGADPCKRDGTGMTPLYIAEQKGCEDIVAVLKKAIFVKNISIKTFSLFKPFIKKIMPDCYENKYNRRHA